MIIFAFLIDKTIFNPYGPVRIARAVVQTSPRKEKLCCFITIATQITLREADPSHDCVGLIPYM